MSWYVPFAGSGMSNGIGFGVNVTVWNVALENVTLSPAAMVSVDGMNWLRTMGYFLNPPWISLCSPRNTVNVLVAEEDAWAPPAMERMARPTQRISVRLKT